MISMVGLMMLAITFWAAIPGQAQGSPPPVVGVYDLLAVNSLPDTPELSKPEVMGLSVRYRWRTIQPHNDEYDWSPIDQALDRARQYGKKVMVRVTAGMSTPDWVYNRGAAYITVGEDKMPFVWDEIYLRNWKTFINAFAQRYRDNPDIVSVQMTGGGKIGEMSISLKGVDWYQYGYSPDLYVNAWKSIINTYRQAFPGKATHLDIHKPFGSDYDTMMRVVNFSLNTYPRQVLIQANDLRAVGSEFSSYIQPAAAKTWVGYQMIGGHEWDDLLMGDRMAAFQQGLACGIVYAEIYQGDLQDETLAGAVSYLAQGLSANAGNLPPVAQAGSNQTVHLGRSASLDGSGSADLDGNTPLAYAWKFMAMPAGSTVTLSNPGAVNPTFTPDRLGDYVLELVVFDSLGAKSAPATVTISTNNSAPVADAGPDQAITFIGATVQLGMDSGRQSYDPDGDPITYQWSLMSRPDGSTAAIASPTAATPTLAPDKYGDYLVELVVRDPWVASEPKMMKVSFTNLKPLANAGPGQSMVITAGVTLDGRGSSDPNGDPLTYKWSLAAVPPDSSLGGFTSTSAIASFTPDEPGDYVAQLMVNDGSLDSDPSTMTIHVAVSANWITDRLRLLIAEVGALPNEAFKNRTQRNTLIKRLNEIIKSVDGGSYAKALTILQFDVLALTDGCAKTLPPAPDKGDWIISCAYQELIYPELKDLVAHLTELAHQP